MDRIIRHMNENWEIQYGMRWFGSGPQESTIEPAKNSHAFRTLFVQYIARQASSK